ncbi:MAG: hypothetical protein Kow0088_17360 [Anaerolineales bacterium]
MPRWWTPSSAVSVSGDVYVTGETWSSDFLTTPGAFDTTFDGGDRDAFVAKLAIGGEGSYNFYLPLVLRNYP